ncbi:hypothetical protein F4824DRAFT_504799 [Ustulina deusta]|nr:hypothetical protein F4824DRAFT_504799 [Ustulina deusta]
MPLRPGGWHSRLAARAIGIAVDFRRQNLSEESHAANVARRTAYKERLIVLPRKGTKHPKAGDSKDIDLSRAQTVSSPSRMVPAPPSASEKRRETGGRAEKQAEDKANTK